MSDGGAQFSLLTLGPSYDGFIIDFKAAGLDTEKAVWIDENKSTSVFTIRADNNGIATWYADGDYRMIITHDGIELYDWPFIKITSDTGFMWEGNFGLSFPVATEKNRWQQFAKVTSDNKLNFLGINTGTEFQKYAQPIGKGADIASATKLIPGRDGNYFDVTGTTNITSIDSIGIDTTIHLHFDSSLVITHDASSLVLPGGNDITTSAGDELSFYEYSSGSWRLLTVVGKTSYRAHGKGADIASAAALTPGTDGDYFDVTGTTNITSIDTIGIWSIIHLHFDSTLTLTHHATNLILPGGADITAGPGDEFSFIEYVTGAWRLISWLKPGNVALPNITLGTPTISNPSVVNGITLSGNSWPSFSVTKNGSDQTGLVSGSWTILTWSTTEDFDTNNDFLNSRFTPTVAGKYLLSAAHQFVVTTDMMRAQIAIYKNGVIYRESVATVSGTSQTGANITVVVDTNGSGDYFTVYGRQDSGANQDIDGATTSTYFSGSRVA